MILGGDSGRRRGDVHGGCHPQAVFDAGGTHAEQGQFQWARAHGAVPGRARLRTTPEDFRVEEVLGFETQGDGEHVLVRV